MVDTEVIANSGRRQWWLRPWAAARILLEATN